MDTNMTLLVTIQEPENAVTREKMLSDTEQLLSDFAVDYKRMAE